MPSEEERHPIDYAWRERFPDAEQLLAGEGGGVYSAVGEGGYWIIQSEAGSASLLDEGENFDPVRLERYDDAEEWQSARVAVLDKDLTFTVLPSIRRYVEAMPSVIEKRAAELGLSRINERDHLQPWSKQTLPRQIPHHRGCEVRSSVRVSFPDHFPRVGDVDLTIGNGRARPAFLELKCGQKKQTLCHCGWDLF